MGPQKKKKKKTQVIFVGSALWEQQKKTEMAQNFFVRLFFVTTHGNEVISAGGHQKTYGTVHAFRSVVQNVPLRTR